MRHPDATRILLLIWTDPTPSGEILTHPWDYRLVV